MNISRKHAAFIFLFIFAMALPIAGLRYCHRLDFAPPGEKSAPTKKRDSFLNTPDGESKFPEIQKLPTDPDALARFLSTSIEIHGKVVDQYGTPVSGAEVTLLPINRYENSYGNRILKTNHEGMFSATGLYGKSMGVDARKKGYLRYPSYSSMNSSAHLSYSKEKQGSGHRHESPETPLVLVLHKIGDMDPMVNTKWQRWKLPLDGTPLIIALDSEKGKGSHKIEFRFRSDWSKLPMDNEINSKQFDWSFEIRITGGGLAWDRSDANFEAPASGYRETIRYEYKATMPREEWKRMRCGRYFVRFADGTYGRIQFDIDGGSDLSPLNMKSWLNLKPGSRNLATESMTIKTIDIEEPEH